MGRSRGIQIAVAIAGAAIVAVLFYMWDASRRASAPQPTPVASAPSTQPGQASPPTAPAGQASPAQSANAPAPGSAASSPPAASSVPASPPRAAAVAPSFDIVRVEPDGSSVVAGRAPAGSTVELLRNGQPISTAVADASGAFAMVPPALEPGTHELTLRCTVDGQVLQSGDAVSVVVAGDRKTAPMVALMSPDKPTQILSRPAGQAAQIPAPAATGTPAAPAPSPTGSAPGNTMAAVPAPAGASVPGAHAAIVIDTVEAEDGRMFVSGRGAPAATVRLYLNEAYVASAVTNPQGQLSFTIERGLSPGDYRVRLDEVDPANGAVKSRAEVAFAMPAPTVVGSVPGPAGAPPGAPSPSGSPSSPAGSRAVSTTAPDPSGSPQGSSQGSSQASSPASANTGSPSAVVIPQVQTTAVTRGDSLWRISRRIYGKGARYTVIYDANHDQIRNHHLIYPGQVFVLPRG